MVSYTNSRVATVQNFGNGARRILDTIFRMHRPGPAAKCTRGRSWEFYASCISWLGSGFIERVVSTQGSVCLAEGLLRLAVPLSPLGELVRVCSDAESGGICVCTETGNIYILPTVVSHVSPDCTWPCGTPA